MEIINIEKQTFERLLSKIDHLVSHLENLLDRNRDKSLSEWVDAQDVCLLLNISPRTLQSYRERGLVPYTQIDRKIYYKSQDIQKLLK